MEILDCWRFQHRDPIHGTGPLEKLQLSEEELEDPQASPNISVFKAECSKSLTIPRTGSERNNYMI